MRLVEQGKVDLSAPVGKYLPEFRVQDEAVSRDVDGPASADAHGRLGRAGLRPERGEDTLKQLPHDDHRI